MIFFLWIGLIVGLAVLEKELLFILLPLFGVGGLTATFALLFPLATLTIRRLNDQSLPWWLFLVWFIPYVGWLPMVFLLFRKGVCGPNRHGPD
ncbi:MAG: DUF805 domain-containing protein, partial [Pacificimonas sp.]